MSDDHGWRPLLDELERRKAEARRMGGAEKLERRRKEGRLNARERLDQLFDPGSFVELGALTGSVRDPDEPPAPADAFVAGFGEIDGRPALAGAEDFTVQGGSIGLAGADKRFRLTQLAAQERVPLVFLLEGAGHRLTNALKGHGRTPNDLQGLASLSGLVPTVCLVMGASAGHGALAAPLMDFVVMVEGAALFAAGPPLVRAAVGEEVTKEELGGTHVHVHASGVAHNAAASDADALDLARRYLGHFPGSAWEAPPSRVGPDTGERSLQEILELVPAAGRRPYPMRRLVELVCDAGSVLEIQPHWGRSLVTTLAFVGGRSVAVVANDPSVKAGTIDSEAASKGARFLEIAGAFHLPVIFLADNPGVLAGTRAEREGALRAGARMFAAQHRLRVPKISITLRKAFGFGSSIMAMNPFDEQTVSLAFPGVTLGAMPAGGGGAAGKADDSTQAALDANELAGPWRTASSMAFDDVIDPRELRNALIRALRLARARPSGPLGPVARVGTLP
jgi:acetyl-CoA carboxylase carboxyltransferase component